MTKKAVDFIKDTFNLRPKNVVGIDLGSSSIKIAELVKAKGGVYKLIKFSKVQLPEGTIMDDEIMKEDDLIEAIKTGLKEAKIKAEIACIGLSGVNTAIKKLQLAAGTDEEIEDQISWEAEQYIPFPIEEATVTFHKIGINEGGGMDVLVAAARNELIQRYKDLVEKTDLKVKIIDLNTCALVNVFEHTLNEYLVEPNLSWLFVEIGSQRTNFMIYKNKSLVFCKEIAFGGMMITEEIQRRLALNFIQAEELKTVADESGNLPENVVQIINEMVESFFVEVKKTLDFYLKTTSDQSFARCYLSGGSALIPELVTKMEELLDIEVEILNPFSKFQYNDRAINEEEISSIAYTGAVALGLAMREFKK